MKICKKLITSILLLLLVVTSVCAVGCKGGKGNLSISQSNITMYVFEREALTLESSSKDAVTWSSTNDKLVKIEANGKTATITALSTGEVTIIAEQGKNSITCKVTVFPAKQGLTLAVTSDLITSRVIGETYNFSTKVYLNGEGFNDATLEYRLTQASPSGCVTINDNGVVKAVSQGLAIVSVRATFGNVSSDWEDVILTVFADDYDNDEQRDPTAGGGIIEDIFGDRE